MHAFVVALALVAQLPSGPPRSSYECLDAAGQRVRVSGWLERDGMVHYWPTENPRFAPASAFDPKEHGVSLSVTAGETIRSNDESFSRSVANELAPQPTHSAGGLFDRFKRKQECPDGQPCPPDGEIDPVDDSTPWQHYAALCGSGVAILVGLTALAVALFFALVPPQKYPREAPPHVA